jgi:phospholipid/cholesterol/gamma-HCH transport system substrate-binding protein
VIRTATKFGLFVGVCLVFTLWLAFTIGNIQLLRSRYELTAAFDDATGLLVNDNVKVAGVVVGKVTAVEVDAGRARVTFEVDSDYELPSDTRAAVRWRNLIGQRFLYLYPGESSTTLEGGDEIAETESVVDLGELFNRLGPIVAAMEPDDVNQFLDTVTQALSGNEDMVGEAIDDLAVLTGTLAERDETIGRLIENLNTVAGTVTARDQQIRTMLDNLVLIARAFSDNRDVVDLALSELGDFSGNLHRTLGNNRTEVDRLIANLQLVTDTVGSRLETVDQALGGLDVLAAHIYRAGSYGEWLNQDIMCAAVAEPPCVTPPGGPTLGGAGAGASSPEAGVAAITDLVLGEPAG